MRSFLLAFLVLENIVYAISLDKKQASSYAVNLLFAALSVFTFVRCRKNKYGHGTTFIYLVSGRHPPLIVLDPLLMAAFLCFFCCRTRSCPPSAFAILAFPTGSLHILRAPCTCYCCCCCCTVCLCCLAAPVPQLFIFIDWNVSQAVKYRSLICSCLARSHETTNSCSCTVCAQLPAACRLPPPTCRLRTVGREPSTLAIHENSVSAHRIDWLPRSFVEIIYEIIWKYILIIVAFSNAQHCGNSRSYRIRPCLTSIGVVEHMGAHGRHAPFCYFHAGRKTVPNPSAWKFWQENRESGNEKRETRIETKPSQDQTVVAR